MDPIVSGILYATLVAFAVFVVHFWAIRRKEPELTTLLVVEKAAVEVAEEMMDKGGMLTTGDLAKDVAKETDRVAST
jgi:hypothetical protein